MKNFHEIFKKSATRISYLGIPNDQITDKLIGLAEYYIQDHSGLSKLSRKVSFLIAECFQNIVRHSGANSKEKRSNKDKDFFQIIIKNDRILICSKNLIEKSKIELLNDKIDIVNSLTKEELKEFWREIINGGDFTDKGGAGLGIIEMARKCGLPLQKKFVSINEGYSDFFLALEILKNPVTIQPILDIQKQQNFYNQYIEEGLIILYKGNFSGETNSFLIEMLHNNFVENENLNSQSAKAITVMIEIIQNASKHGLAIGNEKKGIFSIYEKDSVQFIKCGNYITSNKVDAFKKRLKMVQNKTIEELKKEHQQKLFQEELSKEGDASLGLLEIAIFTKNNFNYSFVQENSDYVFFTIDIKTIV